MGRATPSASRASPHGLRDARRGARRPRRHPLREPPRVARRRPRRSRASARSPSASTRRARPPRSSTCSSTPSSVVLIAEDEEQLDKALAVRDELPDLRHIVVIDPRNVRTLDDPMVLTFAELEAAGELRRLRARRVGARSSPRRPRCSSTPRAPPARRRARCSPTATCTGAAGRFRDAFGTTPDDEVLSYLPLCHVAERLSSRHQRASRPATSSTSARAASRSRSDLRDVQPTLFLGVPRVWEKMLADRRDPDGGRVAAQARRLPVRDARRAGGSRRSGWRAGSAPLDRVRAALALGAGAARRCARSSGFARARRGLRRGADRAAGARVLLGARRPGPRGLRADREHRDLHVHARPTTCGSAPSASRSPGVELRIAEDGEILTRSPARLPGLLPNEEATRETVDADGWLHTGDVGVIDDDGYLTITDRKKDIIITAGGKNISPSEIENKLKVSPYVREAIVIGDRRKYLAALIGIELDTVGDWAARNGRRVHHLRRPRAQARGARADRRVGRRGATASSRRSRASRSSRCSRRSSTTRTAS